MWKKISKYNLIKISIFNIVINYYKVANNRYQDIIAFAFPFFIWDCYEIIVYV